MNLGQLLQNIFNPILNVIIAFLNPITAVISTSGTVVAFLVSTLNNPEGAINKFANSVIDKIALVLPSTPNNLKLGYLLDQSTALMPAFGRNVIAEIFATISSMFAVIVVIKIYKLIPFKAT
jgi:hypothetical protein